MFYNFVEYSLLQCFMRQVIEAHAHTYLAALRHAFPISLDLFFPVARPLIVLGTLSPLNRCMSQVFEVKMK